MEAGGGVEGGRGRGGQRKIQQFESDRGLDDGYIFVRTCLRSTLHCTPSYNVSIDGQLMAAQSES